MVQIFAEEVGALPVLGFKKPSMCLTRVETNHAPPGLVDVAIAYGSRRNFSMMA
jgi:hypothetical protein